MEESLKNYKFKIRFFLIGIFFANPFLYSQTPSVILGRPTDSSITFSILFEQNAEYFIEYGSSSGMYPQNTQTFQSQLYTPKHFELTGLNPNTLYFYRIQYKTIGASNFNSTPEYTFQTQRKLGSNFTFTVEADEHLYDKKGVANLYKITLANQALDKPDFMLSLGDIFGDDHEPYTITSGALDTLHKNYRPFLDKVCHSIPFYVCLGNHEGENDFYSSINPPNNLGIWATKWRKHYYPNPYPNGFYSGNTQFEPFGIGNPENYYAWTWGDALFVVLDVYRDQNDTTATPGSWAWTLGLPQYTWLKNTLESSNAKFKFVFAHHVRGWGRGGVSKAKLFEWGGYDGQGGTKYNFPNKRPGWEKPIHQLFKDNRVNIFFQGHDHVFAHEILDSITYQTVPMAADSTYEIGMLANADAFVSDTLNGTGHLRVSVSPECVKVEFVRAYLPADTLDGKHKNREVAFSYTIGNCLANGDNELLEPVSINIYPNPTTENLNINFSKPIGKHHNKLYNSMGQLVMESEYDTMNICDFPDGVYLLTVETPKALFSKKIIIQKD